MTEWEVVGVIVVLLGIISTVVAWVNNSNKRWVEFNNNLIENTTTLRQIQDYLNRYEEDTRKRFEKHEQRMDRHEERLDEHKEQLIILANKFEVNTSKKEDKS